MPSYCQYAYCLLPALFAMISSGAACGVRRMVGLPLDPNVKTLGAMVRGNTVQVRVMRKALCVVTWSHLLLRVESNGL